MESKRNLCISSACNLPSELICCHCHEHYCQFCWMCHRKTLFDDMQSIAKQMSINREQGTSEVVAFINKQAEDAHEQAKHMVDDAIDRILKASENIFKYIEQRRQIKRHRLKESLVKFDTHAQYLQLKLSQRILLSANLISEFRRTYAYNMFESLSMQIHSSTKNERFFDQYRFYRELIELRQKWTFLQPALTTVYFPKKKNIALDEILTFLEYRHDRVLDNYREYLSKQSQSKKQSTDDLFNQLNFLRKIHLPNEIDNFCFITEP